VVSGPCPSRLRRQCGALAQAFATRLGHAVVLCVQEDSGEPLVAGIRTLVASGAQRLVIVPLALSPDQSQAAVPPAIRWASRRWPFLAFHAAAPLAWGDWAAWLTAVALDVVGDGATRPDEVALLLAGTTAPDPLINANLARLAHLVREASAFARVDHVFLGAARPSLPETARTLARLGLSRVVVVPWLLRGDARLASRVKRAAQEHGLHAVVASAPLAHGALLDVLVARHRAAVADESFLAPSWADIQKEIARSLGPATHGPDQGVTAEEEAQLQELDRKINAMLAPEYQGRYEDVRPQAMGTAPLAYGPDGKVAWNEIWTSFCDLALAGGPPHRGNLLEAVTAAVALAEPEKYRAVVAELERGIRLVTALEVVPSGAAGWVGVRCDSEEMAVWMLRAIIVENVMVRREGDVLYLPAGPRFTLKREIRNVVTVIAKVAHYWTAHLAGRRQAARSPSAS